jgi:hypothetical protein
MSKRNEIENWTSLVRRSNLTWTNIQKSLVVFLKGEDDDDDGKQLTNRQIQNLAWIKSFKSLVTVRDVSLDSFLPQINDA